MRLKALRHAVQKADKLPPDNYTSTLTIASSRRAALSAGRNCRLNDCEINTTKPPTPCRFFHCIALDVPGIHECVILAHIDRADSPLARHILSSIKINIILCNYWRTSVTAVLERVTSSHCSASDSADADQLLFLNYYTLIIASCLLIVLSKKRK